MNFVKLISIFLLIFSIISLTLHQLGVDKIIFGTSKYIVLTENGRISGLIYRSLLNDEYYAFKGIPYAKPPIAHLRFQDPQPVNSWEGVREATDYGSMCPQMSNDIFLGSDDCLYLNIYTKSLRNDIKQSVLVYIHGGGFYAGSSDNSSKAPDYFMRKDIVIVTLNYRIGALGFLNLEDEIAPGNQGLKDQVMALQWIRSNIMKFGGNPNDITICGDSAGAASVHYLTLSPLSKDLFHKAVCQSGVAINTWTQQQINPKEIAYRMCDKLNFTSRDSKEIIEFLKTVDAEKLTRTHNQLLTFEENILVRTPFGPAIDAKSKNPFMPIDPTVIAEQGINVPLLIGNVDIEAIQFLAVAGNDMTKFNDNFEKWIHPIALKSLKSYNMTAYDIKSMYFGNENITNQNYEKLLYLLGGLYFVEGAHKVIKTQVIKNSKPTFFYHFSYDKGYSISKPSLNSTLKGTFHGDEGPYLFPLHSSTMVFDASKKGTLNFTVMEHMIDMWTNFAITGSPTTTDMKVLSINWEPVKNTRVFKYLDIGDKLEMKDMLSLEERYLQYKNFTNHT